MATCPECGGAVTEGLQAFATAAQCAGCGWTEVGRLVVSPKAEGDAPKSAAALPLPECDRNTCALCGCVRSPSKKLIVGIQGAVCTDCIALCSEIIAEEARKKAEKGED